MYFTVDVRFQDKISLQHACIDKSYSYCNIYRHASQMLAEPEQYKPSFTALR